MIARAAMYMVFGQPLLAYAGLAAFVLFAATALIGYFNYRGRRIIPFKWHPRIAAAALALAIIHVIMAFSLM